MAYARDKLPEEETTGDSNAPVLNGIIMKCHTNKCIRTVTLKNMTEGYIVAHADKNGKIFI
ncbi:MAG: hypothetical protein MJ130_08400 [Lachnospiraceae bacterium]|nr:hypothetical protein [Lachnospiraceae bacterium]